MSIKKHNEAEATKERLKEDIESYIKNQTVETLESMIKLRQELLNSPHLLTEEYAAIRTTVDMLEDELFLRGVLS